MSDELTYQTVEVTVGWTDCDDDARTFAKAIGTYAMELLIDRGARNPYVTTVSGDHTHGEAG